MEHADDFASFIEKMARLVYSWERIVYISPKQMGAIEKELYSSDLPEVYSFVHKLVGVEGADEIYLCRNWQFGNQLLINAYDSAEKICYGDSIGIYFSEPVNSPSNVTTGSQLKGYRGLQSYLRSKIRFLRRQLKSRAVQETFLRELPFDIGYFSLPHVLGEDPPMDTIVLDRAVILGTFQELRNVLSIDDVGDLRFRICNSPSVILLTSNFSEGGRMSLKSEVVAYKKFLETQKIRKDSILLIKPHPRDKEAKALQLKSALSELYSDVVLITGETLFFLPFEILFMEIFLDLDLKELQSPKIFAFSSACLSLELLFNVQCVVGFGRDIVETFFHEEYVQSRIEHEETLLSAIQKIRRLNARSSS